MSLRPEPVGEIRAETVRVARAAFPKGTLITRLRDEFSALYQDEDFRHLYPTRGQPGLTPWRLALVTAPSTCWSVAATMHAIRPGTLTPMPEQPRR